MRFDRSSNLCAGLCAALAVLFTASIATAQNSDRYDEGDRGQDRYDDRGGDSYSSNRSSGRDDSYRPPADDYDRAPRDESYGRSGRGDSFSGREGGRDYGDSYSPPRDYGRNDGYPEPEGPPPSRSRTYEQSEIVAAGHSFFGSVTKGLAGAVEYAFKSQGRPNGYILGEDAGGAFMVGLRYGEGRLFTKDAGNHKVYWQGPSLGYDMGAEGSKTMVLVYNMHDPSQIFHRFGGAEGSAYLVGGVSVQFQAYDNVTLAVIRSGVGVRLGANIGYSKYSRSPTWNPL
jgi:hypothetical protein